MSIRKYIKYLLPLCICLAFWKPLSLSTVGGLIRLYFYVQKGWSFHYDSIQWTQQGFAFHNFDLQAGEDFSLQCHRGILSFSEKSVNLDEPHFIFPSIPSHVTQFSPGWTLCFHQVTLEGASSWKGTISGDVTLRADAKGGWISPSGHLMASKIHHPEYCENFQGKIDWEGFGAPSTTQGRIHLICSADHLHGKQNDSPVETFFGELHFLEETGLKWDFSGGWNQEKLHFVGKGFFNLERPQWIESDLEYRKSKLHIEATKEGSSLDWSVEATAIEPCFATLLSAAAKRANLPTEEWTFLQGEISGKIAGKNQLWEVTHCEAHSLVAQKGEITFGCKDFSWREGEYAFSEGTFNYPQASGAMSGSNWSGQGKEELTLLKGSCSMPALGNAEISIEWKGGFDAFDAKISSTGSMEGFAHLIGQWELSPHDWSLKAHLQEGHLELFSAASINNLQADVEICPEGILCTQVAGALSWGKEFSFYCPIFQSRGAFDIRLQNDLWDPIRLAGHYKEGHYALDASKSHILGHPIVLDARPEGMQWKFQLPWETLSTFLHRIPSTHLRETLQHVEGSVGFQIGYTLEKGVDVQIQGQDLKWDKEIFPLDCHLLAKESQFQCAPSSIGAFAFSGEGVFDEHGVHLVQGKGNWKEGIQAVVNGHFQSFDQWNLNLSQIRLHLEEIRPLTSYFGWPLEKIEGALEGSGVLSGKNGFEADLDFSATQMKTGPFLVESRTPIHLYYSEEKGILFRGLDLSARKPVVQGMDLEMPWVHCKIGLLQYDEKISSWKLTHAHIHIPSDFYKTFQNWPEPFQHLAGFDQPLDCIADIEYASNFSTLSCSMKDGFLPLFGQMRHLQNFRLFWDTHRCAADCDLFYQDQLLKMALDVDFAPKIQGRLTIQDNLFIDWGYDQKFTIQAIEGSLFGMEGSFHAERDALIGSVHLDLNALSEMIPSRIGRIFKDLKMGKGYELMGRLHLADEGLSFNGILSGKWLELFGFQLRTLLAQVEISPKKVRLYDVKISDSAGVMTIDALEAKGVGDAPWTLSIPNLTISELRPSLLQRIGQTPGAMSPLVVRFFHLKDLHGQLEDSKTYTAKGELFFINSYRRADTVFDIPSDLLSRIVGLDLDLLIPVCGTLNYELKNGYFQLTELKDAYSERKRSEFFLVKNDHSPRMDLDGNLEILIQMKQFVLFKLTEAFLISIDGTLQSPEYHLQKKKRFLGL